MDVLKNTPAGNLPLLHLTVVALSTCLYSPLCGNKNGSPLSYLDEQGFTKNAHFLRGRSKSVSIRWNYNNLARKLYIASGYWWDQSQPKQAFRGIFSSVATTRSWGTAVVLISWGNCSSWGSLGRGRGFACISWPVLNEVITFCLLGRTAFPVTSEHLSPSQHLCIYVMMRYKKCTLPSFHTAPTEESKMSFLFIRESGRVRGLVIKYLGPALVDSYTQSWESACPEMHPTGVKDFSIL